MHALFSEIKNPRVQRTRAHLLVDILIIGILSVIVGGNGWEDMETYGLSKQDWLKQFLALPNGIPCPDTFRRVFERIDKEVLRGKLPPQTLRPKAFERCSPNQTTNQQKTQHLERPDLKPTLFR